MRAEQDTQDLLLSPRSQLVGSSASGDDLSDAPTQQKGLDLRPLLRVVRRNIILISGIAAIVAGSQVYLGMKAPHIYKGSFRILVEPITSNARVSPVVLRDSPSEPNTVDYPTLLQVLRSPELLSKIAEEIRKQDSSVTTSSLLGDLQRKNLIIDRLPPEGTNPDAAKVVEITYKGANPQQVQLVLAKLAEGYLRFSLNDRKTRIGGGVQFIEEQLPALQQRVNTLATNLQDLKQRYGIIDPVAQASALMEQSRDIRTQRLQAQRELAEQQTLYGKLQSQLGLAPTDALAAASLTENPRYQDVLSQLKKVEQQIAIKAARFNDDSPVLQALQEQRQNLVQLATTEAQSTLGLPVSTTSPPSKIQAFQNSIRIALIKQLVDTANTSQLLQVRNQAITQAAVSLDQKLQQFPAIVRQYSDLQQQLDVSSKTLNQFLTQRETLRVEAAQKEVPWEVIATPSIPKDANGTPIAAPSDIQKQFAIGIIGGLILGIAIALVQEKMRNVFLSSEDLSTVFDAPLLGVIPFKSHLSQSPISLGTGSFAKAFNSLYTNLRFLPSEVPMRSLVVGSAIAGDGRTTVAFHLAWAAAAMGQRVLLVDANLRSPELHTLLNVSNSNGLSELLLGRANVHEVIQPSSLEKTLSVLTAGQAPLDAAKMLASGAAQNLAQQLQTGYDLVIYDSPNLMDFPDTAFLTPQTNGILMVVDIGVTGRSSLAQVLSEVDRFRLPIIGVVANHTSKKAAVVQDREEGLSQGYEKQPSLVENLKA
jgi:capsular exopolysaccharide synthesis family protein